MDAISQHQEPTPPTATDLAIERTLLAHERTLMAWVRTSASLISFGFTIDKFFAGLRASGEIKGPQQPLGSRTFALMMISTGLVALVLATIQHQQDTKKLRTQYNIKTRSLAVLVAGLISCLGIVGILSIFFK